MQDKTIVTVLRRIISLPFKKIYVKTCKEIKFITNMREQVNIETSKELEEKEDCYSVIALLVKRIAKLDE